jgi:acyl-CoA thioesterase-1
MKFLLVLALLAVSVQAQTTDHHVLILGDSLTEGLGVSPEEAYPAQLNLMCQENGLADVEVRSAGVSGATSAGGLARLKWALKATWKPTELLLELGANDGLRGRSVSDIKKDLKAVIDLAKTSGLPVLLLGMKMPYNMAEPYRSDYEKIFPELATEEKISLLPFLLEGVAGHPELNQADGIHPNPAGHKLVAEHLYPKLKKFLHL